MDGMTVGKAGERVGQPRVGVDGAQLAAFDEGRDDGPVISALVGAGKQGVFAIERDGAD